MSKKKGLNFWEFAAVLKPEHRARPGTIAHIKDAWWLLCLHQKSPNGCGRWAWKMKGKQQMCIEVDGDGLWRILKLEEGMPLSPLPRDGGSARGVVLNPVNRSHCA